MTVCNPRVYRYPRCKRRLVEAHFGGADVASDGGVLLLRQADRRLGLTAQVASVLGDERRRAKRATVPWGLLKNPYVHRGGAALRAIVRIVFRLTGRCSTGASPVRHGAFDHAHGKRDGHATVS